jgi:hypothetical protein
MAFNEHVVDPGEETYALHIKVPTQGLGPGEEITTHVTGEHLAKAMHLEHIDLLNPHKMELRVETSPHNHIGVSLGHGVDGEIPLNTHSRATLIDHANDSVTSYHTISTHGRVAFPHTLNLSATPEQAESAKNIGKRLGEQWRGMTTDNIGAGAWNTTINDKPAVLVTASNQQGVKSAVHRLLIHNEKSAKMFEGRYMEGKRKTTLAPDGQSAIIMEKGHFDTAHDTLHKMLNVTSPFKDGLTSRVTNIGDNTIQASTPTMVHLTIHRTAFNPTAGLVPMTNKAVHAIDLSKSTGTETASKPVDLPYDKAVPFEASGADE